MKNEDDSPYWDDDDDDAPYREGIPPTFDSGKDREYFGTAYRGEMDHFIADACDHADDLDSSNDLHGKPSGNGRATVSGRPAEEVADEMEDAARRESWPPSPDGPPAFAALDDVHDDVLDDAEAELRRSILMLRTAFASLIRLELWNERARRVRAEENRDGHAQHVRAVVGGVEAFANRLREAVDGFIESVSPSYQSAAVQLAFEVTRWMRSGAEIFGLALNSERWGRDPAGDWRGILHTGTRRPSPEQWHQWDAERRVIEDHAAILGSVAWVPAEGSGDDAGQGGAPYMPASYFKNQFGIDPARFRTAWKNRRIRRQLVGRTRHYSFPDARKLWPQDVIRDEP